MALALIGFARCVTRRVLTRNVRRTRQTIIRPDDGIEMHGFGNRLSLEANRANVFNRQAHRRFTKEIKRPKYVSSHGDLTSYTA